MIKLLGMVVLQLTEVLRYPAIPYTQKQDLDTIDLNDDYTEMNTDLHLENGDNCHKDQDQQDNKTYKTC